MKEKTLKLFEVTCRGMIASPTGTVYGHAFIVATNPTEAYEKFRKKLDNDNIGFQRERELDTIKLIAEDTKYPDCKIRLYM